jgi:hypothetical protein
MKKTGDEQSKRIWLDVVPLFFHRVNKTVQALVITYDETFLPLAVGADVLLPKNF